VQAVHFGFKIGDLPVPVRYFDEMSSISIPASARYALQTFAVFGEWYANKLGLRRTPRFQPRRGETPRGSGDLAKTARLPETRAMPRHPLRGATAIAGLGITPQGKVYGSNAVGFAVDAVRL